jgi:hypothetical protein
MQSMIALRGRMPARSNHKKWGMARSGLSGISHGSPEPLNVILNGPNIIVSGDSNCWGDDGVSTQLVKRIDRSRRFHVVLLQIREDANLAFISW